MSKHNDNYTIIVLATAPIFTAHTYTEIYGGSAGCTITVNDVVIAMGGASSISVWVRTVSGGAGCFLLGVNQNVTQGSTQLP